jgi:small subunit ribosomal protein S9
VADKRKFYVATGRRKTSVARVRLCDGSGKIEINGRPLDRYFTEERERSAVTVPMQVSEFAGKLDLYVNVHGGGFAGQAGAIRQGVARALIKMLTPAAAAAPAAAPAAEGGEATPPAPTVPPMVKKLRDAGLLTRDARMKERKKYGRRGARRSFQFSKR